MPKYPTPEPMPEPFDAEGANRVIDDHDPTLEPYASMSREAIVAAMEQAEDLKQWTLLREFFLDKCSEKELEREDFLTSLTAYLLESRRAHGPAQVMHVYKVAAEATRALFDDMPPMAALHLVN